MSSPLRVVTARAGVTRDARDNVTSAMFTEAKPTPAVAAKTKVATHIIHPTSAVARCHACQTEAAQEGITRTTRSAATPRARNSNPALPPAALSSRIRRDSAIPLMIVVISLFRLVFARQRVAAGIRQPCGVDDVAALDIPQRYLAILRPVICFFDFQDTHFVVFLAPGVWSAMLWRVA